MQARYVIVALLLSSCVRNPATGKLQLDLVSEGQEVQLGQDAKTQTEQTIGVYQYPGLNEYVANVGKELAAKSGRTNLPFTYEIADDSSVNAFALPGGPIFITRGILTHLTSEAQLAAVMGHETGHVAARHSANQLSKAELAQLGLGVGSALSPGLASAAQVAGAGMQVLFLKFSRDAENQADELGFRYMTQIGYDPRQMIPLFQMLDRVSASAGSKLPQWLETHPDPQNRVTSTQDRLKSEFKGDPATLKVGRDEYLQKLDGMVFGEDPRKGYFKGDSFYEPELRFQVQMPAGWKHANQPDAVVAVTEAQDAMFQLAPAQGSPQELAQKFFSQQGVVQGRPIEHGTGAYFTAQTQQGAVEGLVSFLSHAGHTYAMLGYTAQGGLAKYDGALKSAMASFGPLTDAAALNVQPARLKIVRIDQPLTAEELNARHPSNAKLETVELINGVARGEKIPAGYAKQILGGQPP